jgi:hypothetical protein
VHPGFRSGCAIHPSQTETMKIDTQRLRNLTTRRLHTEMQHIYEDLETIIGENGLMTHMLPRVVVACEPWLREHVTDPRFWDGLHDPTHVGEVELPTPSKADREAMFALFAAQPNPLASRKPLTPPQP